ncbi:MAG TPA: hypothetical protein VG095_01050 [Chthoniobacterales bacterium]|nr:hypothetical protein [Chthoniobacterales bacterium]
MKRLFVIFSWALFSLTSCQTTSPHQFATPTADWKTKTGQLAYTGPRVSLIGEVLVRYSSGGDFELIFSKGPGLNMLVLRQDEQFASAEGPLARGRWSGRTTNAPARLRGWLALREKIMAGGATVRFTSGADTFNLRF